MSLTKVQSVHNTPVGGSSSQITLTFPGNVVQGNLLVLSIGASSSPTVYVQSVTDTKNNVWFTAAGPIRDGSFGFLTYIWFAVVNSSGPLTITVTYTKTGTSYGCSVQEINSSIQGTWALDGTPTGNSQASTNPSLGSITTSNSESYVVGTCMTDTFNNSAGTGFTLDENYAIGYVLGVEHKIASPGSTLVNFVNSTCSSYAGLLAAFSCAPAPTNLGQGKLVFVGS